MRWLLRHVLVAAACLMPAQAMAKDSILGALTRTAKNIDSELCRTFQASRCKETGRKQRTKRQANAPAAAAESVVKEERAADPPLPVAKPQKPIREQIPEDAQPEQGESQTALAPPAPAKASPAPNAAVCLQNLASAGAIFAAVSDPPANAACSIEAPVRMTGLKFAGGRIALPDEPLLSCSFALQFSEWIAQTAAKAEKGIAPAPIARVWTGPGYDCRNRNGDTSAKMSEHAYGNAVDIDRIGLADGTVIAISEAWTPSNPHFAMLQWARASACTAFTTVLGPGSNADHQGHFHLDMAKRKGGYRICQ